MTQTWGTVAAACAGVALLAVLARGNRPKNLPPGPPKLPLLDNLLNMPDGMDYKGFVELGRLYKSEIIHLSALGTSVVVLNSYKAARDLLEKRSAIYSSRAESVMMHELCHLKWFFAFSAYGDWWRACRRLFTKYLNPSNSRIHRPSETLYTRRFLVQLLDSPGRFRQHIRHLVGAASIATVYGLEAEENDPIMKLAEGAGEAISTVIRSGTYLVDIIPFLQYLPSWFPGTSFLKEAHEMKTWNIHLRDDLFNAAIKKMDNNHGGSPSLVSECIQDLGLETSEDQITRLKYTAAQTFAAGADTTVSAITSVFLAMVCYPEVQKRLQEELDLSLRDKTPTHEDIETLPYLNAVLKEVLRWNPVTPIGVPHRVITDDVYEGYFIPKDSVIVANQWAMLHDPAFYSDPFAFKPERFLKDGKIDKAVLDPAGIAFGFGRRICAGNHIAQSILKMTIALVVYTFDITKAIDENGQVIEPNTEYESTFLSHPKEFACVIKPRSSQAEERARSWAVLKDQETS